MGFVLSLLINMIIMFFNFIVFVFPYLIVPLDFVFIGLIITNAMTKAFPGIHIGFIIAAITIVCTLFFIALRFKVSRVFMNILAGAFWGKFAYDFWKDIFEIEKLREETPISGWTITVVIYIVMALIHPGMVKKFIPLHEKKAKNNFDFSNIEVISEPVRVSAMHDDIYSEPVEEFASENIPPVQTQETRSFSFFVGCTDLEILKQRHKSLVKTYHPDGGNGDTETMQYINAEYDSLKEQMQA